MILLVTCQYNCLGLKSPDSVIYFTLSMENGWTEFQVAGVSLDRVSHEPRVLLRDSAGEQIIGFDVGPYEATSIIEEMEGSREHAASAHGLIARLFKSHGFRLRYLKIRTFGPIGHQGSLCYTAGRRTYTMDVPASDGIALAVRLHAPIYVDRSTAAGGGNPGISLGQAREEMADILAFSSLSHPQSPEE